MANANTAAVRNILVRPIVDRHRSVRTRPQDPVPPPPPISNARIGMVMFLVAETMFFAGLVGAYLVFRVGSIVWPPAGQPHLPLAVTWVNTFILLASGWAMLAALRAVRCDDQAGLRRGLAIAAGLGTLFVVVQGSEWVRLIEHGLTLSAGTYGATFYTLIGTHALHVMGGLTFLGVVWVGARHGRFRADRHVAVELCVIYWFFVCVLWLALFALVYP